MSNPTPAYNAYPPSPPSSRRTDNYGQTLSSAPLVGQAQYQSQQQYPTPYASAPGHQAYAPPMPKTEIYGGQQPHPHAVQGHPHPYSGIMHETEQELTEDEREAYESGILTWDKAKSWKFWIRKEWTWYYVVLVLLIILVGLMAGFHHQIVNWLTPFTRKLQVLKAGFLIPVAILFVLSFPPLFGNEIVMILIGIVWGLGVGFAITAVGMGLGEIANYFVFKYWCAARAERMTKKSLNYACLTQVVRDGGFWMAFMIRLSAIPTHFSTVLFAVCGLPFWQYCLALVAGLPKQLIAVYVGVVLAGSAGDTSGKTPSTAISDSVFAVTALITIGSLYYIYRKMIGVRKKVLIGMRKELAGKGVTGVHALPGETGSGSGSEEGVAGYGADGRRM